VQLLTTSRWSFTTSIINRIVIAIDMQRHADTQMRWYSPKAWYGIAKHMIKTSPIEIALGAAIGLAVAAPWSYIHERERSMTIPLAFSEKTQIERDAKRKGIEVGPLTAYLTSTNDAVMKVFECWNKSHEGIFRQSKNAFAHELEMVIDPTFKYHHYDLKDLLTSLPKESEAALVPLKDFVEVMKKAGVMNRFFRDAWSEDHDDHYKTETYTETDSKGNITTHTREVYDYTTHTYIYRRVHGEAASQSLDALVREHSGQKLNERILRPSQTNAEGEYAAERSMLKSLREKFTHEQLLEIASTWNHGSTLNVNMPVVYSNLEKLNHDSVRWRTAKATARSAQYDTYSSSDSGPREFGIAKTTLSHGTELHTRIDEIVKGIQYVQINAPVLHQKVREYLNVTYFGQTGDRERLKTEIMDISRTIYASNFKRGLDTKPFRGYLVFLIALAGTLAGAGAGYAADQLGEYVHARRTGC
jgi:hypothetical protein